MRILGFSKKDWINYNTGIPKLQEPQFTTFRFPRKDRDWQVNEVVQVVYKPRSKDREILGIAQIVSKEPRDMVIGRPHKYPVITLADAMADGFNGYWEMWDWLVQVYPRERLYNEPMNKLTLRKIGDW